MSVVAVIEPTVDRVQSIGRIGAVAAKPPGGSRILTEWRAGQEQARRQRAANAEMAKAMETFRRHHTGQPGRRSVDAMVAELPPPAFGLVSGQRAHGVPASAGQRAFAAGGTDRLSAGWIAFSTGINADLEAALATLRARSRDWWMNTSDGERFAALVADNIVGPDGPRLQMRVKRQAPTARPARSWTPSSTQRLRRPMPPGAKSMPTWPANSPSPKSARPTCRALGAMVSS